MCPTDDSTTKSGPSRAPMVRAFAGDSTMTRGFPAFGRRDWEVVEAGMVD
jgi:hypothetical protein